MKNYGNNKQVVSWLKSVLLLYLALSKIIFVFNYYQMIFIYDCIYFTCFKILQQLKRLIVVKNTKLNSSFIIYFIIEKVKIDKQR